MSYLIEHYHILFISWTRKQHQNIKWKLLTRLKRILLIWTYLTLKQEN